MKLDPAIHLIVSANTNGYVMYCGVTVNDDVLYTNYHNRVTCMLCKIRHEKSRESVCAEAETQTQQLKERP